MLSYRKFHKLEAQTPVSPDEVRLDSKSKPLPRVQPESTSAEKIVGEVDYLDVTIQRDAHGWHCDLYDKRDAMPSQPGGEPGPEHPHCPQRGMQVRHSPQPDAQIQQAPSQAPAVLQSHRQTIGSHDNSWLRSV